MRRAFKVSQGSLETLFSWGGKHLHDLPANLFQKLCAKFYQNHLSRVEDIPKNILISFFRTHCTFHDYQHLAKTALSSSIIPWNTQTEWSRPNCNSPERLSDSLAELRPHHNFAQLILSTTCPTIIIIIIIIKRNI